MYKWGEGGTVGAEEGEIKKRKNAVLMEVAILWERKTQFEADGMGSGRVCVSVVLGVTVSPIVCAKQG